MDESQPHPKVTSAGLEAEQAAVRAARDRLGITLERLDAEVRSEVSGRVQQTVWKLGVAGAGVVAAAAVKKGLSAAWRGAGSGDPPDDPADPLTPWKDALLWTIASAVGIALAQLATRRGADAGWRKLTGAPPPGRT